MRVGVEVGGTFTDLVAIEDGMIRTAKVPSTPHAPEVGAIAALRAWGGALDQVVELAHGSTVATNAILERKGARVCLLVTQGTRDLLYLQRHNRRYIYDLHYVKPAPVVERKDTFEVAERLDADGAVVMALDEAALAAVLARIKAQKVARYDAIAVAYLNSYANPSHEQRTAALIAEAGIDLPVTLSHEVMPVFREYERYSTTALSAYVQPVISAYLERLESALAQGGFSGHLSVMQSNGGRLPAAAMGRNAISSLFSGPAAGVVGATRQAARSALHDIITLDMGGTSTDVCLVEGGQAQIVAETQVDGLPIKMPGLDIETVGAGGGSIIWVDDGGMLRVGPQSAGAAPGPACYGRGGGLPTITDAHVVRGTMRAGAFLGGAMPIDAKAARAAVAAIAGLLGLAVEAAADAAIRVAESNVVRAIQRLSTERGKDPRGFALVPFGGAGPMQAVRVAEELGLATVVVPPHAGVLSALGLLACDYVHYETQTRRITVRAERMGELRALVDELRGKVMAFFAGLGMRGVRFSVTFEMRYVTQAFEIPVSIDEAQVNAADAVHIRERFDAEHTRHFEFAGAAEQACEIVSVRVGGAVTPAALPAPRLNDEAGGAAGPVEVFEQGKRVRALCVSRGGFSNGACGPMIIEDTTSTVYLPEGWHAHHDAAFNLIIEKAHHQGSSPGQI
ncbi:MAG: hydantoinase/oxoprolinase family protein [Gammaproteobacteria bacterium]|nr:hydantoinase/oxoprolinase family protein [Gammaproteobacteria bacterium]